jgi:murein DD-endopeptidase MepM/ murein hydrolase activator NlpD
MAFPLSFVPSQSWHTHPRNFGTTRPGGRKHAGCDLYAPVGTPIYAVEDGRITIFRAFYLGTWAIVIEHGGFIVRYGECKNKLTTGLSVGSSVKKGQKIGEVGKLQGLNVSMIHFEMFSGNATGPLTDGSRKPFSRRADLMDPTPFLDQWSREPLPT